MAISSSKTDKCLVALDLNIKLGSHIFSLQATIDYHMSKNRQRHPLAGQCFHPDDLCFGWNTNMNCPVIICIHLLTDGVVNYIEMSNWRRTGRFKMAWPFLALVVLYRMLEIIIWNIDKNRIIDIYDTIILIHLPRKRCFCPWKFFSNSGYDNLLWTSFISHSHIKVRITSRVFQA